MINPAFQVSVSVTSSLSRFVTYDRFLVASFLMLNCSAYYVEEHD